MFRHIILLVLISCAFCQRTYLQADGNSNETYNLLNEALGKTCYEVPDCIHLQMHITQANDTELGVPVFVFDSHINYDNDRCINDDRIRTEIKGFDKSAEHLKCYDGDTVAFYWDVKFNAQFQPSNHFTHIFQVKGFNGEANQPFITITPKLKADGKKVLQLLHSIEDSPSAETSMWEEDLAIYEGKWLHINLEYTCGVNGSLHLQIRRKDNNQQLMDYKNDNILMWRTGNSFLRPKWGIYRSLHDKENLRDEQVYFNNFCFSKGEGDILCTSGSSSLKQNMFALLLTTIIIFYVKGRVPF